MAPPTNHNATSQVSSRVNLACVNIFYRTEPRVGESAKSFREAYLCGKLGVPKPVPKVGTGGPLSKKAIGSSHRPQMAVTSRYTLKAPGRGLGGGTPASEVSTIVIEAHAIHDAQPRGRDFVFVWQIKILSRHGRRRRRRLLAANDHGAKRV